MHGSIVFILHLFGFGVLCTTLIAGWIIERQQRHEQDIKQKLFMMSIAKKIGLLSPLAAAILLFTGIGNIYNVYGASFSVVLTTGWLSTKIILFAVLLVNGTVFGPLLVRKRRQFLKNVEEKIFSENIGETMKELNKNITVFYFVQFLLVIIITCLSVFGTGKHPGSF